MNEKVLGDLERRALIAARPGVTLPAAEHFLSEEGEVFRWWRLDDEGQPEQFSVIVEGITTLSRM